MSIQITPPYRSGFFVRSPEAEYYVPKASFQLKVLLVSDNALARYAETHILADLDCIVSTVAEYSEVLPLLIYPSYQAVFIDWLPNAETIALCWQIQARCPSLPIIAITSTTSAQQQAEKAGVTAGLMRPMVRSECQQLLAQIKASYSQEPKLQ